MKRKIMKNVFKEMMDNFEEFFEILFYKEENNPKELPTPLKKYTITAIFPSRDIMEDAMKNLR